MSMRAVFFVAFEGLDWIGTVQAEGNGPPVIEARLRHHDLTSRPDTVWDGVDRKSWLVSSGPILHLSIGGAIGAVREAAASIAATHPAGPAILVDSVVQEDGDEAAWDAQCATKRWYHVKRFKSEEEAERFLKSKAPS